jgi:hypothetical protein
MAEFQCQFCDGIADPLAIIHACEPCAEKMPLHGPRLVKYHDAIDRVYEVHAPGAEILDWLERQSDAYEHGPMLLQLLDILVPKNADD